MLSYFLFLTHLFGFSLFFYCYYDVQRFFSPVPPNDFLLSLLQYCYTDAFTWTFFSFVGHPIDVLPTYKVPYDDNKSITENMRSMNTYELVLALLHTLNFSFKCFTTFPPPFALFIAFPLRSAELLLLWQSLLSYDHFSDSLHPFHCFLCPLFRWYMKFNANII